MRDRAGLFAAAMAVASRRAPGSGAPRGPRDNVSGAHRLEVSISFQHEKKWERAYRYAREEYPDDDDYIHAPAFRRAPDRLLWAGSTDLLEIGEFHGGVWFVGSAPKPVGHHYSIDLALLLREAPNGREIACLRLDGDWIYKMMWTTDGFPYDLWASAPFGPAGRVLLDQFRLMPSMATSVAASTASWSFRRCTAREHSGDVPVPDT